MDTDTWGRLLVAGAAGLGLGVGLVLGAGVLAWLRKQAGR